MRALGWCYVPHSTTREVSLTKAGGYLWSFGGQGGLTWKRCGAMEIGNALVVWDLDAESLEFSLPPIFSIEIELVVLYQENCEL